jgi:hypothetical protein
MNMKKCTFLFGLLGAVLLTSCNLGTVDSDYSPQLQVTSITLNGVAQTTTLDTLKVGDVLQMSCVADGVSKPLTAIQIANDTIYSDLSFMNISALDPTILNRSNPAKGYLVLDGLNIYTFAFSVQYKVKKANKDGSNLIFIVNSTSQYSPRKYMMKICSK